MHIEKNTVVSLKYYKLSNLEGEIVDESTSPVSYLHGGYGGMFPVVEAALQGKEAGYSLLMAMEPEETFGEYDSELVRVEPRSAFPENVEVGMQFEGSSEENPEGGVIYTVTDVTNDIVVVDGNHPLAGIALKFECIVMEVRAATPDELAHGHVHGPHGHDH